MTSAPPADAGGALIFVPMPPHAYIELFTDHLRRGADPVLAERYHQYTRRQFPYYGWRMADVRRLGSTVFRAHGLPVNEDLADFCTLAFEQAEREYHHLGCWALEKAHHKCVAPQFVLLEELIETQTWWDTVDWLAKVAGAQFVLYPDQIVPVTERWMQSKNLWLQRVCLIFQLRYRERTDTTLLFSYILRLLPTQEFFLQKAMGWALRQHTRTDAAVIKTFVQTHETILPNLTKREALRLL